MKNFKYKSHKQVGLSFPNIIGYLQESPREGVQHDSQTCFTKLQLKFNFFGQRATFTKNETM